MCSERSWSGLDVLAIPLHVTTGDVNSAVGLKNVKKREKLLEIFEVDALLVPGKCDLRHFWFLAGNTNFRKPKFQREPSMSLWSGLMHSIHLHPCLACIATDFVNYLAADYVCRRPRPLFGLETRDKTPAYDLGSFVFGLASPPCRHGFQPCFLFFSMSGMTLGSNTEMYSRGEGRYPRAIRCALKLSEGFSSGESYSHAVPTVSIYQYQWAL